MKQSHIREIISKRVETISTNMAKVDPDFDKEVIHQLRVGIKGIRAFMRMLASRDDKHFKLPRKFKQLYDISGTIREAQLEVEHLQQMDLSLPGYLDHLHQVMDKAQRQWKKHYKQSIITKLERKLTDEDYEPLKEKHVLRFIEDQLHSMHGLCIMPVVTDDVLHSVRKRIKDILHCIKVLKKEMPEIRDDVKVARSKELDHFADMIGDYNDARIMLLHLTEYSCETDDLREKQVIQNLLQESSDRLKREKLAIVKQVLQFLDEVLISASPA